MADQKYEHAQAQAIVEFLASFHAGGYSVDAQRPDTVHRNQPASDFGFSDALGNRVGSIEITTKGEHLSQTTRHQDTFKFKAQFPRFKQDLEKRFHNQLKGAYTVDVPWDWKLPTNAQKLEEFVGKLKAKIDAWPDDCRFQRVIWQHREFFLARDSSVGSSLSVHRRARWTRAPKSQDLIPALNHIVRKFQHDDHQLTIGAVDVSDWAAASDVDRGELADALKDKYPHLSHLFLITPSHRSLLGVRPGSVYDNGWQKCGRFDVLMVW